MSRSVVLVGFMGSGKSRVGRALAGMLRCAFTDLDVVVAESTGGSIAQIFEEQGEAEFRALEFDALRSWLRTGDGVLATGGGVVENENGLELLRDHHCVIWLDPPFDELRERLARATHGQRPLVSELGWAGLKQRRDRRRPLYAACADFRFESPAPSAHAMAQRVRRALEDAERP